MTARRWTHLAVTTELATTFSFSRLSQFNSVQRHYHQ